MLGAERVLDRLSNQEKCIAALFTSYTFDPGFFEDHVLRTILNLSSDPIEHAERYHHEARLVLQETPVAVIVDAAERQPGRRLPFDLLDVSKVVFHPKSALILYAGYARLLIGSGNLTPSGYGGNTELFVCVDLFYSRRSDADMLRAFVGHMERLVTLVRVPGTQFALIRAELQRRLDVEKIEEPEQGFTLLDSTQAPILAQFLQLLPSEAVVTSISLLAPFFERDDDVSALDQNNDADLNSVFQQLAKIGPKADLHVAMSWENARAEKAEHLALEQGLGRIWTRSTTIGRQRSLEYFVPTKRAGATVQLFDAAGERRRWSVDQLMAEFEQGRLWVQPEPEVYAPKKALQAARGNFANLELWLHPATRVMEGQVVHRPLHAKLIMIGLEARGHQQTLLLIGSPNMSRRALLMPAGEGRGNVELAVACLLDGDHTLKALMPELVYVPEAAVSPREREFPAAGPNYALAIEQAVFDPTTKVLAITWSAVAQTLPPWRLLYGQTKLADAPTPPSDPLEVANFVLLPTTAELVLEVNEQTFSVPILVTDLAALPVTASGAAPNLDELLLLLGRRMGAERVTQLAEARGQGRETDKIGAHFFGDRFSPTDVFRAWWAAVDDLRAHDLSLAAFQLQLNGTLGLRAAWRCILDAAQNGDIGPDEAWFYGVELLQTVQSIALPPSAIGRAKSELLTAFQSTVKEELPKTGFKSGDRAWLAPTLAFYDGVTT